MGGMVHGAPPRLSDEPWRTWWAGWLLAVSAEGDVAGGGPDPDSARDHVDRLDRQLQGQAADGHHEVELAQDQARQRAAAVGDLDPGRGDRDARAAGRQHRVGGDREAEPEVADLPGQ